MANPPAPTPPPTTAPSPSSNEPAPPRVGEDGFYTDNDGTELSARVVRALPGGRVNLCVFTGIGTTRGLSDIAVDPRKPPLRTDESWTRGAWRRA